MSGRPCFAIPCIGPASRLQSRITSECARAVKRCHPGASVYFLGNGPISSSAYSFETAPAGVDLPLQADWIKAQAFRAIGSPVWVIDADLVLQRPFPDVSAPALQPYHYPLIEGREVDMADLPFCPTIACWFQAVDVFEPFRYSFLADSGALRGERAAKAATLSVGGVIAAEPFICAPRDLPSKDPRVKSLLAAQPENPHAIHYVGGLKFWHYG